jgi:hypothetical protein
LVLLICLFTAVAFAADTIGTFTVEVAPEGDAPQWIKDAWIGITMPYQYRGTCHSQLFSKEKINSEPSYQVDSDVAIGELKKVRPDAAKWWKDLGFPEYGVVFCFRNSPRIS